MRQLSLWMATLLAGAWPVAALAQQSGQYQGHMWDGGWHGWIFGPIIMIAFFALAVVVVVLVVRWLIGAGNGRASGGGEKTPLDILKERYARGEIDKDEYEERRRTLER